MEPVATGPPPATAGGTAGGGRGGRRRGRGRGRGGRGGRSQSSQSSPGGSRLANVDPLKAFLRSQHECFKGSTDVYFSWLSQVKGIPTMAGLKIAVQDDSYLNNTLKDGNGISAIKGFKIKAFRRAVLGYEEPGTSRGSAIHDWQSNIAPTLSNEPESIGVNIMGIVSENPGEQENSQTGVVNVDGGHPSDDNNHQKKAKKKRNRNKKKKLQSWKKYIPKDAADPISLDPLAELDYPPFAVVVDEPYVPVYPGQWPVVQSSDRLSLGQNSNPEEERQLAILKRQWGEEMVPPVKSDDEGGKDGGESSSDNIEDRNFNLFDGQVLAFYLVSTLQFIDPFNRRDLTRPELCALDAYLDAYNLGRANVVEAFDEKGVSLSTAGAAAQTSAGRAEILRQQATGILAGLYDGSRQNRSNNNRDRQRPQQDSEPVNQFRQMYAAQEEGERNARRRRNDQEVDPFTSDHGVYDGDGDGLLVIDVDINPGLRSGVPTHRHQNTLSTQYSATQIASTWGQAAQARTMNFPSLPSASGPQLTIQPGPQKSTGSKSLSKIGKLVQETDPKQVERQKKAREEAQRRAHLAKQNFFSPDSNGRTTAETDNGLPAAPSPAAPPSDALLARNRNLADALGVKKQSAFSGWARPVGTVDELNAAAYPDALLREAKERMAELLKLEKQWKAFLADDRSPSLSLKAMDKPLRKFVHEYSDFWSLHTESFDPEGRRYIYCKKLVDTSAPYPLLSEAARRWIAPVPIVSLSDLPTAPTSQANESHRNWLGWNAVEDRKRVPLNLKPRSAALEVALSSTQATQMPVQSEGNQPAQRFAGLGQERIALQLAQRSIPSKEELEKRKMSPDDWEALHPEKQEEIMGEIELVQEHAKILSEREKAKQEAREQKKVNQAKKKIARKQEEKALLASAFADDSDDDGSWSEQEDDGGSFSDDG